MERHETTKDAVARYSSGGKWSDSWLGLMAVTPEFPGKWADLSQFDYMADNFGWQCLQSRQI